MVRAIMIVEMAGRPAEHLTEAIEKHVGILKDVEDLEVHEIKVSEPRVLAYSKGSADGGKAVEGEEMFSVFAECDIEAPSFSRLSDTMFDFMPSSVEVIEPSNVKLESVEATGLLNNISGRLHRYDEIAKILGVKYKEMEAQLKKAQGILGEKDAEIMKLKKEAGKKVKKVVKKKSGKKLKKKSTPNAVLSKKRTSSPSLSSKKK